MLKEIKEKFPCWCEDTETKFELMMSDDIDALMCYQMQKLNYGREVEYFINSSKDRAYQNYSKTINKKGKQYLYHTESATNKTKNTIVLDFSVNKNVKAWDNHVVNIRQDDEYNHLSANMNININSSNYTKKYCISSFITMLSYYDIKIQNWEYEELICLCAIDGLYQPFKNDRFVEQGSENIKNLGYDFLIDFIKENLSEIESFDNKYLKNKTIWINNNGYLETNLDLNKLSEIWGYQIELPSKQFKLKRTLETEIFNVNWNTDKAKLEELKNKKIFNIALTYGKSGVVSYFN
ncbi:hypothetical protein [Clostridium butyricum]